MIRLITQTDDLAAFCRELADDAFVTVDTEFVREKTYAPQLCLIQIAGQNAAAAIDPLVKTLRLDPLFELLSNPGILKVFHAARQDLEVFYALTGRIPLPLFDTQVAAMVCGFGESVGYENLIGKLVGTSIDKSSRYSDWARRPLTDRQLAYALADVTHLRPAYEKLRDQMHRTGRESWIEDDMNDLSDPANYVVVPEEAWRKVRARTSKPRTLAIVQALAAWREREAQARNLPRNWVLKDEAIVEIASHPPVSMDDLARMRGLGKGILGTPQADSILAAVAQGRALPEDQCPQLKERPEPTGAQAAVAELFRVLLKMKAEDHGVAPRLIATQADLEQLAMDTDAQANPLMNGWRRTVFGEDALALKEGHKGLIFKNGRLAVIDKPL